MISFGQIETQLGDQSEDRHVLGYDAALLYLRDRGITSEFVGRLGIRICLANDILEAVLRKKCFDDRLAVVFPHHKLNDEEGAYDWWSARLVPTGPRSTPDKRAKMFCPPGEPPVAFLPWTLDWSQLKKGDKVYIHESAIKAANGATLDRWSIGINGVRGWSSAKHNLPLIDGLREMPWRTMQLVPVIVFDSNTVGNPEVEDARRRLAARLVELTGQYALTADLPKRADGTDQGFDDYRVAVGDVEATRWLDAADTPIEIGEYEQLLIAMNENVVLVRNMSRVVEIKTGTQMTRGEFTDVNYAHITLEDDEGMRRNFPRMWLSDPRRGEVERLVYSPGHLEITDEFLNLWKGMGVEPAEGDVQPWLDVLEHGVPDPALRKWVTQWFAYPLANLGAKMNTFIHMYGPPGLGKNALLTPICGIYGRNSIVIGKDSISSTFNSVYAQRQFVNLDELHGGGEANALAITNRVKMLVTSPDILVNTKGSPEYTIKNHINLVTTSNYSDSLKLDDGDRRALVLLFGRKDLEHPGREYWDKYFKWALSTQGQAALYDYLIHVDMSGFDPDGHAPGTRWKDIVTDATRGAMEKWVRDLWEDPTLVLPPLFLDSKVLSPEQVAIAYMPEETHKITPGLKNALGQRMQDCGFERYTVKVEGQAKRLWVIADRYGRWDNERIRSEWVKASARTKGKF